MTEPRTVAYFSMEIAIMDEWPTYAGGLGVLAGDTVKAAADLKLPFVAVTLLSRKGYFRQSLAAGGAQTEADDTWEMDEHLEELPDRIELMLEGRALALRAWRYHVKGISGGSVAVIFLDSDLAENDERSRGLTDHLYGGDARYRLCQEVILGIGGVRILRSLGYGQIHRYHMNEGHAALLTLELLEEKGQLHPDMDEHSLFDQVRERCIFTTHTPVAAGHDRFPLSLVNDVLGQNRFLLQCRDRFCIDEQLNLTYQALFNSHYVNGVAKRHGSISQQMFPQYQIDSITNGVHAASWVAPAFAKLFDHYIQGWRADNASLRYALNIPPELIRQTHQEAKQALLAHLKIECDCGWRPEVFTLCFARRATAYKRPVLLFQDIERLNRIAAAAGGLQIIYAGKAHPRDKAGKDLIRSIHGIGASLAPDIRFIYLPDYNTSLARLLVAGADCWLNTPLPPLEASGTSGMKAALNGVPSLSILDGWWLEGCIEGVTGWAIGVDGARDLNEASANQQRDADDAASLYDQLEQRILPLFYRDPAAYAQIMRNAIALNGAFFTAERMLGQYVSKAYY